jgi:hypothetical protein
MQILFQNSDKQIGGAKTNNSAELFEPFHDFFALQKRICGLT